VLSWQKHIVIQLGYNRSQLRADQQKIDDEPVLVKRPSEFRGDVIIVAVQPLALAVEGDKVRCAKDMLGLGHSDAIGFGHKSLAFSPLAPIQPSLAEKYK
jgi:hypothetical protein